MSYAQERSPTRQMAGFGLVVLLHALLGYFILSGLASRTMEVLKGPLEAKMIEEVKPPPPDAPPPPPPELAPPPPPFIPPPEVNIQAPVTQTNAIQAVTTAAPVAPPPPPAPKAAVPDQEVSAKPIAGEPLKYPPRMLSSGREGYALVECTVDTTGKTSDCKLDEARGGDAFGDAAMDYVKSARYHPAIRNGQPVTEKRQWKIDFKLHD